jgi:hypothetical protein
MFIAYTKYPLDKHRKQHFLKIEQEAKKRGVGLWDNNGLSEINWILNRNYHMIQARYIGNEQWELGYWKYIIGAVHFNEIEANVTKLYSWIYELSSMDLHQQLIQTGYKQNHSIAVNQNSFFIVGMAHKKWGILYENHVLPRVHPGELDNECRQLNDIINKNDQTIALVNRGYRLIHTNYPDPPIPIHKDTDCPNLIGQDLSTPVICWDQASQFIGQTITVTGLVTRTFKNDKVCFLNFHNNFTKYMSIVIFSNNFKYLANKPETYYQDKTIYVTGKIKEYKGKPEIILSKPSQIRTID